MSEIEAMRSIAAALGSLRDAESRERVLDWLRAHFACEKPRDSPMRILDGSAHAAISRPADASTFGLTDEVFQPPPLEEISRPALFVPVDHGPQSRPDSWREHGAHRLRFQFHYVARALRRLKRWQRAS